MLLLLAVLSTSAFAGPTVVGSVVGGAESTIHGVPALVGTTLFSGDTLEVGDGGAEVTLVGGSQTIFASRSEATFERDLDRVTVRLGHGLVTLVSPPSGAERIQLAVGGITIEPVQGLTTVAQVSLSGREVIVSTKEGSLEVERFGGRVELGKGKAIKILPANQAPSAGAGSAQGIGLGKLAECMAVGGVYSVPAEVVLHLVSPSVPNWQWGLTPIGPGGGALICTEFSSPAPPRLAACSLTADRKEINLGESVTLSWVSPPGYSDYLSGVGQEPPTGQVTLKPESTGTKTYELSGKGPAGTLVCMAEIKVKSSEPTTCTLEADRTDVPVGDSVNLSWSIQGDFSNTRLLGRLAKELTKVGDAEGSFEDKPPEGETLYQLTGTGGDNKPFRCTAKVSTRRCMITADKDRVAKPGDEVTLTWQVVSDDFKRAEIVDSSGSGKPVKGLEDVKAQGSAKVYPTTRTTYTLRWWSSKGREAGCSIIIYVGEPPTCSLEEDPSKATDKNITLKWTSQNAKTGVLEFWDSTKRPPAYTRISELQLKPSGDEGEKEMPAPKTNTFYRLLVDNGTGETHECHVWVETGCSLKAKPPKVKAGGAVVLTWRAPGAKREIDPGVGEVPVQGTREVNPTQSTVYKLTKTPGGQTPSCKTCVTVPGSGKPGDGSRTLDIPPLFQHTAVWCWLAVSEMVFRYYKVNTLNPVSYQCGIVSAVFPRWCGANCLNCVVGAGSAANIQKVLREYPPIAGAPAIKSQHLVRPLTPAEVKAEIDAGRPVIAGISPSPGPSSPPQHVALITGYVEDSDGQLHLIVNDPYPLDTSGMPNPYVMAGAQNNHDGSTCIRYDSFSTRLRWTESFTGIQK